ncbi:MAG TPA: NifU family protein [Bacteroidia bacterium]|nr:NifU family protein [Bacteroidia bacterium]
MEIKRTVTVYAEMTPNPQAMKFVTDIFLCENPIEYASPEQAETNPLAKKMFEFPAIKNVFILSNFITLTKEGNQDWYELIGAIRESIRNYFISNEAPVLTSVPSATDSVAKEIISSTELETKIKSVLEEYVRPAVEQDGGAIDFKSFKDGKVTLLMRGSCSGCPSSSVTLKGGIENLFRQMVPEVTEVVAEEV